MFSKTFLIQGALAVASVAAQRPSNVSICDYYTTALLKQNTAANQYMLLKLIVNTAEIGNYTQPNVGIAVPGILNPNAMYMGQHVNLLKYFDGSLLSTNVDGSPASQNFLDGGGAAALKQNLPAFNTSSNQFALLTHLYEFFGILLGCTMVGDEGFPKYGGTASMYTVHKFMAFDQVEVAYFNHQVALAAASFGVAKSDYMAAEASLNKLYNNKCGPPVTVAPAAGPVLQSICLAKGCPAAPMAQCGLYDNMDGTSSQPLPAPAVSSSTTASPPSMTSCPSCPTCLAPSTVYVTHCPATMMSAAAPSSPTPSSECPADLSGDFLFPTLIIPVSKANPMQAYGTSYFGEVSTTVSSVFNFDFPASYAGKTCKLMFIFPSQSQLQTSSYSFSGSGGMSFTQLTSTGTLATTFDTLPDQKASIATISAAPGNAYTLATYPCPASSSVAIEAMAEGDTSLKYFQDYNSCPIGLYITAS